MTKWAILIPTLAEPDRERSLSKLLAEIDRQRQGKDIIVITLKDKRGEKTTGRKRNELIQAAVNAGAEYVSFVDDDDFISRNYIQKNLEGIELGFDCNSLWGQIYWSGKPGKPFHHSIIHREWWEDKQYYYRCVNHLNVVKLSLVKDIPFPDKTFGEDGVWSYAVRDAGVLKSEYQIKDVMYHYYCGKK